MNTAMFFEIDDVITYGKVYYMSLTGLKVCNEIAQSGSIGIATDTYETFIGKDESKSQIAIALNGMVLACVDKEYEIGTPLMNDGTGNLTEMPRPHKITYPERILAIYIKKELSETWGTNQIIVSGRHWVKVL